MSTKNRTHKICCIDSRTFVLYNNLAKPEKKEGTYMELRKRKDLLDMKGLPTQEELRVFFIQNDWTAVKPYDFMEWEPEKVEDKQYTQKLFNTAWNKAGYQHGQKASPRCYAKDYPDSVLKHGIGDIVSGAVVDLVNEKPDVVERIFDSFSDEFMSDGLKTAKACMTLDEPDELHELTQEDIRNVDRFLDSAMNTLLDTVGYKDVVDTCKKIGTPEDFTRIKVNYPRSNFEKKYNHTDAETEVFYSTPAMKHGMSEDKMLKCSPEELAEGSVLVSEFFDSLSETDYTILTMTLAGYTQNIIAEAVGLETHSAVHKRMNKIREQYLDFDPEFRHRLSGRI